MFFRGFTENAMKKMDYWDMKLVKLGVFALALMMARLWPPLLSLDWYWYALIFVLAAIRPLYKTLGR
jgi:hypothetical protein